MARIRQFAKDMGLSYNEAKRLVNKGRKLKDGGSSVLESTMNKVKPVMASNGKYGKLTREESKMKMQNEEFKDTVKKSRSGQITPEEAMKKIKKIVTRSEGGGLGMQSVKYGLDNNPKITAADPKAKFIAANKKGKDKPVEANKGAMIKMRDGGQFRGCGAQVKGKKFKGIF